jgi:hypothetical protein
MSTTFITYTYLSTEEKVEGIQVRKPSADSLQSTPEDDPEADDSQMEILHERTLYHLCGFDDDDEIHIRPTTAYKKESCGKSYKTFSQIPERE